MLLLTLMTIFAITVVCIWWFGFWSNLILFVNMLIGAMVATAFFQNITSLVLKGDSTIVAVAPIASIWGLFFVTVALIRAGTDSFSRIQLKFDPVTEMVGRTIMSLAVASLFMSFTAFTLHLAPIPPNIFPAGDKIGPEIPWAIATQYWSTGTLSESKEYCLVDADLKRVTIKVPAPYIPSPFDNIRPWDMYHLRMYDGNRAACSQREYLRISR